MDVAIAPKENSRHLVTRGTYYNIATTVLECAWESVGGTSDNAPRARQQTSVRKPSMLRSRKLIYSC